jgi:hypothetical protein
VPVSTWASFPVPAATAQYRLGLGFTTAPTDFVFNTQHGDGSYVVCKDIEAIHGLEFLTPIDLAGGRDGGLVGPTSIGVRTPELNALFVAPSAQLLWLKVAALRSLLAAKKPLILEWYDWGYALELALVAWPTGKFQTTSIFSHQQGGLAMSVSFQLVASSPLKYLSGSGENASARLINPALITGRTYDKTYSYNYGSSADPGGVLTATNLGDSPAYPVFTITGPVNFPTITNVTTGQSFQVNAVVAAGATVVVDASSGAVTPGSTRLIGRPFTLAPGPNTIRWTDNLAAYDPAATLRLDWRSTFK